jgi:hypothetical protein
MAESLYRPAKRIKGGGDALFNLQPQPRTDLVTEKADFTTSIHLSPDSQGFLAVRESHGNGDPGRNFLEISFSLCFQARIRRIRGLMPH